MPFKHGVYVNEQATSVSTPIVAETGVPYFFGASCITAAEHPAEAGIPVLITSWEEFCDKLGYSADWKTYNLCEAAYSHFKLFNVQPAIFCNLVSTASNNRTNVAADDYTLTNHQATIESSAIRETIVVKAQNAAGNAWEEDADYTITYTEDGAVIEVLSTSSHYSDTQISIAYSKANTTLTDAKIAEGVEAIENCMALGIIPDLIASPGYSGNTAIAALMAAKAAAVSGIFRAKAVIDLPTGTGAGNAHTYDAAYNVKTQGNYTDENEILCWGLLGLGDMVFHQSTQICSLMAQIDAANEAPYESPSNKNYQMDRLLVESGDGYEVVRLTKAQADILNSEGIVTALNFLSRGWVCWGNWTACYPGNSDVKDIQIPVSRMFDWIANTCIKTFWVKIDQPMTPRLVANIVDTCNIWLNGLKGSGKLIGARVEFNEAENPPTDLMQGIMRLHIFITPPSAASEINFTLEYDISYLANLFENEEE